MALSKLRMHHLRTGALPARTEEERIFLHDEANARMVQNAGLETVLDVPLKGGEPIDGPQPPDELPSSDPPPDQSPPSPQDDPSAPTPIRGRRKR